MEAAPPITFARGAPSLDIIPADDLRAAAERAFASDPAGSFSYGTSGGYVPLRDWIAERHAVTREQVIATNGSMQADAFLFQDLVQSGDTVVVEAPTYDRTLLSLKGLGAEILAIPMEADGLDVEALAHALEAGAPPKLAHIIPNFQHPAGATLSLEKRRRLLELASQYEFVIFEDDPYGELRFEGESLPTMLSLDTGDRVVYASSFSKTVCPGVRVGYLVGPGTVIGEIQRLATETYISPSMVAQSIVAEFCRSGALERSIETVKGALRERCDATCEALRSDIPDATFTPRFTTRQGVLLQGEFRQRLINGSYQIRAYGIDQLDPGAFAGQPGDRTFRGGIDTKGQFALNDKWVWGWDGVLLSDYYFFSDYRLSQYKDPLNSFLSLPTEAISQLYLTGVGNRSYFDARTIYYLSFSGFQEKVPVIHPVVDYSNVLNHPIFGGEFSYKTNFTSLTRSTAAFDPITTLANTNSLCVTASADPLARLPAQCLLRGIPGTYTRLAAEAQWRRSFTDSAGEIWTPFASVRADAIDASISNQPGVSNFLPVGDTQALRVMPTVGLEYRYPFINVQPWGSTTIEPIAQVIIRPNEPYAGKLPNEDAQSLVYDTSNLFSVDKFSGYDRVEGGGRANVGVQATTQFDRGGAVKVLFGQSYQLFGLNSFAVQDMTNTGLDSGLATPKSDYVGSVNYSPNRTYTFSVRTRLDQQTLNVQRFEAEGRASFDRWSVSMMYGNYAQQPELGYLTRREGLLGSASVKLAANWVMSGAARWDLEANKLNQYIIGAGYVDDCFVLAANYVTSYTYAAGTTPPVLSHAFMLQIGLRTLANTASGASGIP